MARRVPDSCFLCKSPTKGSVVKTFITVVVTVVVVLALVVGLARWAGWRADRSDQDVKQVRIDPVARGDLVEVVRAPGEVEPKTKVSISARIAARIVALPFKEGDRVTRGDPAADPPIPPAVLVRLDASDLEAALLIAEARRAAQAAEIERATEQMAAQRAEIDGLKASLDEAQSERERQSKLLDSQDVSQSSYDQANRHVDECKARHKSAGHTLQSLTSGLAVLHHQLEAADAEITRAKDTLSHTIITSPLDGVVSRLNAEVGELVVTGTMNNPGTVILEVADLSEMLAVAQIDESDIGAVEPGQPVRVSIDAYPDRRFKGVVDSVALIGLGVGFESKAFRVEILLDGDDQRIFSGLTAEVEIETRRHEGVLKVPSQAVLGRRADDLLAEIRDDNPNVDPSKTFATVVYRHADGKAVVTPVTVGPSDATHTIVRSGLTEGDRVITGPFKVLENLKHDQPVKDEGLSSTTRPAAAETVPAR